MSDNSSPRFLDWRDLSAGLKEPAIAQFFYCADIEATLHALLRQTGMITRLVDRRRHAQLVHERTQIKAVLHTLLGARLDFAGTDGRKLLAPIPEGQRWRVRVLPGVVVGQVVSMADATRPAESPPAFWPVTSEERSTP